MLNEYSKWFFNDGWLLISVLGFIGGWFIGFKSYYFILPLVITAIISKV